MNTKKITKITKSLILCVTVVIISVTCIKSHKRTKKRLVDIINEVRVVKYINTITNDITQLPKTKGNLRLVQKASIEVLKRFDQIAKKHNIIYWLDWGTLLGAIRHKGFIPWDDDIDIAMEREEYEKILPILEEEFNKDGFTFKTTDITRLFYKDTPAQVDIFPFDRGYSADLPVNEEYQNFLKNLKNIINWAQKNKNFKKLTTEEKRLEIHKKINSILFNNKKPVDNGFLFHGIESYSSCGSPDILFEYKDIFPLRKIIFEGMDFYAPNNTRYYLYSLYNDYMSYPDHIEQHVDIMGRLNRSSYKNLLQLVGE